MSTETVAAMMGAYPEHALWLERACIEYRIETAIEKAHFLGHIHHETEGFRRARENLNYSAKRLAEVWPARYAINPGAPVKQRQPNTVALRIGGDPAAIANLTYSGRLGNVEPGDGWLFIGRGDAQLTGRANVTAYSRARYGDDRIVKDPSLLEQQPDRSMSAGWFFSWRGLAVPARRDDVEATTKLWNGGYNGLDDRRKQINRAKSYFQQIKQG